MERSEIRRALRVALPLLALLTATFEPGNASADEFQLTAAINDDDNETIDKSGWQSTQALSGSDPAGVTLKLLLRQRYVVEISGTFQYARGTGRTADAECSLDVAGDPNGGKQWQARRWLDGWGSDLLDVKARHGGSVTSFDWTPVEPFPVLSPSGELLCSSVNRYRAMLEPSWWEVTFFIDERVFSDNAGQLNITVSRGPFDAPRVWEDKAYDCPRWTAENTQLVNPAARIGEIAHAALMIDSRRNPHEIPYPAQTDAAGNHIYPFNKETGHWGMYTCNWALTDGLYRITVDGVWKYEKDGGQFALADAECATGAANYEKVWKRSDPRGPEAWMDQRYFDPNLNVDYLDVYVNDQKVDWKPLYPDPNNAACSSDAKHTYFVEWKPDRVGPIRFTSRDWAYYEEDNSGMLCVHVQKL